MTFWKPGTIAPGKYTCISAIRINVDREAERESNETIVTFADRQSTLSIQQQRQILPIYKSRNQLLYLVEKYQVTIVVGQTGSGKTTQLPQYLHEAGWTAGQRVVACTQPRRVAATTVAQRVAIEMNVQLGQEVGYSIRFEECYDVKKTRIKYMTDGMLFRETLIDPLLSQYSVIMIDEAHERSLHTDILFGLLKKIMKKRPELRVIISSATLDAEAFYDFFNINTTDDTSKDNVSIISIEGRMFPVDIHYLEEPCSDYIEKAIETVMDIHLKEGTGDILVFLTGREQIDSAVEEIANRAMNLPRSAMKLDALPIYAGLPAEQQLLIFESPGYNTRKVIVATNIAEASITIEGISYVIDCGFVKLRAYNPKTGMESLVVVPVSKSSAQQRAGRAGRLKPGKAYRLYTEDLFRQLPDASIPEMQRTNLAQVVLQLKALGVDNILRFDFLTAPPAQMMIRALELLYSLKALDDNGKLTVPLGVQLAEFPVDPMLGKILLDSPRFGCCTEILIIAAMISVQNVFIMPSNATAKAESERRNFAVEEGDHLTLLNVYTAFTTRGQKSARWCHDHFLNFRALSRAFSIRSQLLKFLKRFNIPLESCGNDTVKIRKCLVSGYFANAAKMMPDGSFRTIRDNATLHIHPSSVLFTRNAPYVIFHEVVETTKAFMRDLTVIDPAWLSELAPHFYEFKK
ncbi:4999_t:CDS:10 [Paraglomus brasilianum]|uniref:RNA helicase n=1 Tax=Paraglomus brasilianum TaxID=144538 RepID=A0A9N9AIZ9_9GLOM|nr:4999_t:CDS:10 [Paraglomus brasilianum]